MRGQLPRSKSFSAQSAMEYLMTYGWSILILAVVLGALFGLGVFNGAASIGSGCIAQSGYLCQQAVLSSNGTLSVDIGQVAQPQLTIVAIGCSDTEAEPTLSPIISLRLESGQTAPGTMFQCPLVSNTIGSSFTGTLWIEYTVPQYPGVTAFAELATLSTKVAKGGPGVLTMVSSSTLSSSSSTTLLSSTTTMTPCSGDVWVADSGGGDQVTELACDGSTVGTFSVGSNPSGIAIDQRGNVWVTDFGSAQVTELSSSGNVIGTYGTGSDPSGIAIDANDDVWIADYGSSQVTELSNSGSLIGTFSVGSNPEGISIDSDDDVWIADFGSSQITELSNSGSTIGTFDVSDPRDTAIDSNGDVWIPQFVGSGQITELSSSGNLIGTFATGVNPYGVAIDSSDNVWVADTGSDQVTKLSNSGSLLGTFSASGNPPGLAIDSSGNVWVADQNTDQVTELSNSGSLIGAFAVGNVPYAVATGYIAPRGPPDNQRPTLTSYSATPGSLEAGSAVSLSATVTGGELPYTNEQWYVASTDSNSSGVGVSGGYGLTSNDVESTPGTYYYYVIVTGENGYSAISPPLAVTFTPETELLASGQDGPFVLTTDGTNLYWADYGGQTIESMPLAGGSPTTLATGQGGVVGIATDGTNVYWTDSGSGEVEEEPIGGPTNTLLANGLNYPFGIATDGTYVYWTNFDGSTVDSIPVLGGSPTTLVSGTSNPTQLILYDGNLYWITPNAGYGIYTAPDTGGSPTSVNTGPYGLTGPNGFTIYDNVIYLTVGNGGGSGAIDTVPVTGGTPTPLITGLNTPTYITTDGTNLYWIDGSDIYTAPIGGGTPQIFATGATPSDLIYYGGYIYWTDGGSGNVYRTPT